MISKKTRIHELAKVYGMTSKDLVAKLQSLGFAKAKGPQSALDEFQVLQAQGMLEANGVVPQQTADEPVVVSSGGLTVRKKKKKKLGDLLDPDRAERAADAKAAASSAAAAVEPEHAAPDEASAQPPTAAEPVEHHAAPEEAPASARAPGEPPSTAPVHGTATEVPERAPPSEAAEDGARPAAAERDSGAAIDEAPPEVETVATPEVAAAPAPPAPAEARPVAETAAQAEGAPAVAENAETTPVAEAGTADPAPEEIVKPSAKRRAGKVVGFVDLSKIQAAPTRSTSQGRRLHSKDDVTPDVKPTFGHDRRRALVRGSGAARGTLTASQLKEKESGRFLRRSGGGRGADRGRGGGRGGGRHHEQIGSPLAGQTVKIEEPITVKKLAETMSIKVQQVLGKAMSQGSFLNINSVLDKETAELLALEFEVTLNVVEDVGAEEALLEQFVRARTEVEEDHLVVRPPTIAFLGHVDHGKTTLLDRVRDSRVVQGESGGITQHIGAYQVQTKSGHTLTILDTPGHEAFTAMRARGAQAVDIAVLVVAADDGVKPSTLEAISHARAAKTPIVVALNKCDKPEANPSRVRNELAGHGVIAEEFGGEVAMIEVSALKGTNVDALLERVFLESEVLELKAHDRGPATGIVLEAEVQEGKGKVAYLLVKDGTLNQGDVILAGEGFGKVRSIHDDRNRLIKSAGPSKPVEVSGLSELPSVGDEFHVVEKLDDAKEVAEERAKKNRVLSFAGRGDMVTMGNLDQALSKQDKKTITVVLKADVQGSLEAIKNQLEALVHDEVEVKVIHAGLGTVTEGDTILAAPSNAAILAFHVGSNEKARQEAKRQGVEIRPYEVIYELLDDIRAEMEGALAPEWNEQVTGRIEVRVLFKSSKFGTIAGSHVISGAVQRDNRVRVFRGDKVIHEGTISQLRREKETVKEVREGFDCGVTLKDFDQFEPGDVVEGYKQVAVKRLLKI